MFSHVPTHKLPTIFEQDQARKVLKKRPFLGYVSTTYQPQVESGKKREMKAQSKVTSYWQDHPPTAFSWGEQLLGTKCTTASSTFDKGEEEWQPDVGTILRSEVAQQEVQGSPTCFTQYGSNVISLEDAHGNLVDFDMLEEECLPWLDSHQI